MSDKYRGHEIFEENGNWYFKETGFPVASNPENVVCGLCGLFNSNDGHDGCLGELPGVMNACCGHGETNEAYVQWWDGSVDDGEKAIRYQEMLKNK